MNVFDFARLLVEKDQERKVDPLVRDFNNRLLLRIFHSPALLASLIDNNVRIKEGAQVIELDFKQLPEDVIPQVKQLIGAPYDSIRITRFHANHVAHTGFEVSFTEECLEKARDTTKKDNIRWYAY